MDKRKIDKRTRKIVKAFSARVDIERGRVEALACVLLTVLGVRGIDFTQHDRDRIVRCFDSAELGWWVVNASTATDIGAVFQPRKSANETARRLAAADVAVEAMRSAPYMSAAQ